MNNLPEMVAKEALRIAVQEKWVRTDNTAIMLEDIRQAVTNCLTEIKKGMPKYTLAWKELCICNDAHPGESRCYFCGREDQEKEIKSWIDSWMVDKVEDDGLDEVWRQHDHKYQSAEEYSNNPYPQYWQRLVQDLLEWERQSSYVPDSICENCNKKFIGEGHLCSLCLGN
jgi:hypothetical protein